MACTGYLSSILFAANSLLVCAQAMPAAEQLRTRIPNTSELTRRSEPTCNQWHTYPAGYKNPNEITPDWMPIANTSSNSIGYESALSRICDIATNQFLGPYEVDQISVIDTLKHVVISDGGYGMLVVIIDVSGAADSAILPEAQKCKDYLKTLGEVDSPCYGSERKDTIGGKVEGEDGIIYYAIPGTTEDLKRQFQRDKKLGLLD